ncbi:MAG: dTMP kinase [Candidatus Woesearchaeota archaeon]
MNKGLLFTFEGIDYAGKSTVVKEITQKLQEQGHVVSKLRFYEPGGTPYADLLRMFIKKTHDTSFAQTYGSHLKDTVSDTEMSPLGQALSFFCAREHQFYTKIRSEIEEGKIVLLDRSVDSTAVYQGHAQNPGLLSWIRETNALILSQANLHITQTYLIHISMDERKKRMESRGIEQADRFESQGDIFAEKIQQGYVAEKNHYDSLPNTHPQYQRIHMINGEQSISGVVDEVYAHMMRCLEKQK